MMLLVEDDRLLAETLVDALSLEGHGIEHLADGEAARQRLDGADHGLSLVLLDLNLPGCSGLEVLETLRRHDADTPVLILTARGAVEDRIKGLEAGADDYLAKPFEPRELLLRANAILRRTVNGNGPVEETPRTLSLGAVRYDVARGEMWRGDEQIRLTTTESALMRVLARTPHEPVDRLTLLAEMDDAQERAVDVQMTRLRRKIEEDPKAPRYLQTVRGAGYMLAPD